MKTKKVNPSSRKWYSYERIYCFPNRHGFLGFAVFLVMVSAGAIFQNNLVYMMAFLFLGLGLVAILQTARNIRNVSITQVEIESGFPGQWARVRVTLKNPAQELKLNLTAKFKLVSQELSLHAREVPGQNLKILEGEIQLPTQRGEHLIGRVGFSTTYPYMLFRAWKYCKVNAQVWVYPKPEGRDLDMKNLAKSAEDFSGHKLYEPGDQPSRIDWKIYSRRNEYYVRQFNDGGDKELQLTWEQTADLDFEKRLSQFSRWVLEAEKNSIRYDIRMPGFHSGLGLGGLHYNHCMEALAKAKDAA